jgi:RNA polymerase sigma factor (sigma-70 family)
LDDADLVSRARRGERDAFADLVARHLDVAMRTARQMGAGDDADDVVQEAFVKAYRRLSDYRGDATFRSWLLAIVANETRNLHRSRRRRDEMGIRALRTKPVTVEADTAVSSMMAAEDRRTLVDAVRELDDPDRDVIAYRYLLDRTEAETAALLDWPLGTVKSRTARALAKLRTRLGVAIAVLAVVVAIIAIPPARSAVGSVISHVFRFAGVEIRHGGGHAAPTLPASPAPIPSTGPVTLAQARRIATFPIGVPAVLGVPEKVLVSDFDPAGAPRVVSLLYRGGAIRVDEFDGQFDLAFTKVADDTKWLTVGGAQAVWLPTPHPLTYVDRQGVSHPATTRLSGPTLLCAGDGVDYRVEGAKTQAEAVRIAGSIS